MRSSFNMTTVRDEQSAAPVHFKRRKPTLSKRAYIQEETPTTSGTSAVSTTTRIDVRAPPADCRDEDDAVPNLREILRNRKRPRDRFKDVERKAEAPKDELPSVAAPRDGHYTSRFVAQTGQVVDRDDKHM